MTCEHLRELEQALIDAGMEITYRGQAWGNAREWVYFDCVLDLAECRLKFTLPDFVVDHVHRGTHDGTEQGLYCKRCLDGVMGRHPEAHPSELRFP
jgi:hypothetical protein